MNNITNESITLDEIWKVFNKANKDGEYLLSSDDEDKITKILKNYAESANDLHPRVVPVLHKHNVNSWRWFWYYYIDALKCKNKYSLSWAAIPVSWMSLIGIIILICIIIDYACR